MILDLNWESLQERRARACVIMMHKIQNSLVAIPPSLFTVSTYGMTTRGAPVKFIIPHCNKLYQNTFVPSAASLWNSLPAAVATTSDPESFRRAVTALRLCG